MLKNNKILKAQMGISLPLEEVVGSIGGNINLDGIIKGLHQLKSSGANTIARIGSKAITTTKPVITSGAMTNLAILPLQLAAYAMTQPHAASGAVQIAHQNQLAKEKEDAIKKEQQYWNKKADFYSNALSNGAIMTPTGIMITNYNPSTRTLSGYKDGRNGDRIFLDKNLQTGVYSNPVYKDAKTGAYYEGTLDLNGTVPIVGRGENLMPYSIIPVKKPEWIVSNPSDVLRFKPIVFNENNNKSSEQSSGTSSETSENPPANPKPTNEDDKKNNNSDENYNKQGYKKSSVEEWMREFPEKVNKYRRWRIGNSNDVWHNKSGNISWDGTKLINRGTTPTNTSQLPSLWGTRLKWGIGGATGGVISYGIYSSRNNKPEKQSEFDGNVEYVVDDAIVQTNNTINNSSNNELDINSFRYY